MRAGLVRSVASDNFLIARVGHSHSFWISIGDFCDSFAISSGQADSVKIRAGPDRSATTSANVATQSWNLKHRCHLLVLVGNLLKLHQVCSICCYGRFTRISYHFSFASLIVFVYHKVSVMDGLLQCDVFCSQDVGCSAWCPKLGVKKGGGQTWNLYPQTLQWKITNL